MPEQNNENKAPVSEIFSRITRPPQLPKPKPMPIAKTNNQDNAKNDQD